MRIGAEPPEGVLGEFSLRRVAPREPRSRSRSRMSPLAELAVRPYHTARDLQVVVKVHRLGSLLVTSPLLAASVPVAGRGAPAQGSTAERRRVARLSGPLAAHPASRLRPPVRALHLSTVRRPDPAGCMR
jgi:hypothetical protein